MLKELIYDIPSISLLNSDKILFTILDNLYSYDLNNKKERLSQKRARCNKRLSLE